MPEAQTLLIVSEGTSSRNPGLDLRLARGDLPLAGLQHLAVDHLLDLIGRNLGALQRGGDRRPSELHRALRGQRSSHLRERGASGAEDDCLRHLTPFFGWWAALRSRHGVLEILVGLQ